MPANREHPFEPLVESFSEKLVSLVESIPEQEMPFGAVELTGDEQLDAYLSIREDAGAWVKLIEEHGMRDAVDYVQEMERRISKQAREE